MMTAVRIGDRSGRLTVVGYTLLRGRRALHCWCDCGTDKAVQASDFARGATRSCGCLRRETTAARNTTEKRTHGLRAHPLYRTWVMMRVRCLNPHAHAFEHYGGRGIKIDPRWDDFAVFVADMGERPMGTTLDRVNNDGDYTPSNCRWATAREQRANQRKVVRA